MFSELWAFVGTPAGVAAAILFFCLLVIVIDPREWLSSWISDHITKRGEPFSRFLSSTLVTLAACGLCAYVILLSDLSDELKKGAFDVIEGVIVAYIAAVPKYGKPYKK